MVPASLLESIYKDLSSADPDKRMDAVSKIYKEFRPIVFKKMRYKFNSLSENDVQDIVQDSFLKIYTTKSLPNKAAQLPSWIFKITENTALDLFRKAYNKYELQWPEDDDDNPASGLALEVKNIDESKLADKEVINSQGEIVEQDEVLNRNVEICVDEGIKDFGNQFPERQVVISMAMDGTSIADIADSFKRTEAAMKQFIYECKKKLSPFIAHCLEEIY